MDDARKTHLHVESQEGTVFYTDELGREHLRVASLLALSILIDNQNHAQVCFWHVGTPGNIAEMIARYLVSTPGMMEAVQGLYVRELKVRSQGGG